MINRKGTCCGGRAGPLVALGCIVLLVLLVCPVAAQTLTVAASDSSAASKATANYVCDGINDQVEINNAFNALPGEVGTVQLTEGTFHCSGIFPDIHPTAGSELLGRGQDLTVIEMFNPVNSDPSIVIGEPGITLRGFTIRGQGAVTIRSSQVIVQDVTATSIGLDGKRYSTNNNGMFYIRANGNTLEDIIFINCQAVDSVTHGFHLNAVKMPRDTRNIRFIGCQAIRCGFGLAGGSPSEWITGYNLQEDNDLYDVQLIGCLAEDNWESGFHFEPGEDKTPPTVKKAITMTDCVSRDNGQRNPQQYPYRSFLSGYYVHFNAVLTNCISENNKNAGYFVQGGKDVIFNGCTDTGSAYGWKIVKAASDITLNSCTASDNRFWGLWSAFADHIVLDHFSQNNVHGYLNSQSMLGWYYDEGAYQLPVTDSSFNITAYGDASLPIINQEGEGNTYSLSRSSNDSRNTTPTVNVTPTPPATHPPVALFQATPMAGSAPLQVSFTDLSTGSPANWSWNFGDGSTSTLQNPQHQYLGDGIQTVTLTVSNVFGSTNTTQIITVGEGVFAGFTATPRTITAGQTIQFTDRSSGAPSGWLWNFGDGSTISPLQNPKHQYGVTGVYSVQLTASFPGSSDHETKTDYIIANPEFSADTTTGMAPATIRFTDTTPNGQTNWHWDFGDGTTSNEMNPVHLYQNGGNYTVTLTATSPYGTMSVTKDAYIHIAGKPLADFTSTPQVGTVPFNVTFTDTSVGGTAVGYYWQFGDGTISTMQNPVHTYTSEGVYTVDLTVYNLYGVTNTSKIACVVANLPTPIADFTAKSTAGSAPLQVQFSDHSLNQPGNWFWQFGDGSSSTEQNPLHLYTTPGAFTVSLMVRNSGGAMTVTKTNFITVAPPVISGVIPILGQTAMPTDIDHDGLYEDLNGNKVTDFNDVVIFFNQMDWIAANEPVSAFDFNHNGQIDFNDIVLLFNMI